MRGRLTKNGTFRRRVMEEVEEEDEEEEDEEKDEEEGVSKHKLVWQTDRLQYINLDMDGKVGNTYDWW